MALIICPDCDKSISDAAPACIHCGRPVGTPRQSHDDDPAPTAPAQMLEANDLPTARKTLKAEAGLSVRDSVQASLDLEVVYYESDSAYVSSKIVRFQGRSFNPSLITSVSCGTAVNPEAVALAAKIVGLSILGAGFLFLALLIFVFATAVVADVRGNVIIVGLIIAAVGGLCIWRVIANANRKRAIPPLGSVDLDTSSGMGRVAITFRYQEARKICQSIEQMLGDKH
jgi:hypothetical protein